MSTSLSRLIEMAKAVTVSEAQKEEQRRSFVYGNTAFENRRITREMVDREADELKTIKRQDSKLKMGLGNTI
jgi:hypothetical protein